MVPAVNGTMSFTTPLLDYFRRGAVDCALRLVAGRGAFATRAQEQASLLMLLVSDADPEVAQTAEATLRAVPPDVLGRFLARSDVSTEIRAFFSARGIEPTAPSGEDGDTPLVGGGE